MDGLEDRIKAWGAELGFGAVGIADADLSAAAPRLAEWLGMGWHGEMDYMARHEALRARPAELFPGTASVITCRLDYLQDAPRAVDEELADRSRAYVARYARGRDYHKVMRTRLQRLCDLPLKKDSKAKDHCGTCQQCIDICPTRAITGPYKLDARRCISYLTIEHKSAIPEELRPLIGNRVYGCDDCQLVCPWNGFSRLSPEKDFAARNGLDRASLIELFAWTEAEFDERLRGSPIRRIGYERWLRNIAVGLGNAPRSREVIQALLSRKDFGSDLVREHIQWALKQHDVET